MIKLEELLTPERAQYCTDIQSVKKLLEHVAALISNDMPNTDPKQLFEAYLARERLGSTGIGHGVAIPHIRSDAVDRPIAALIHLENGIPFGANDEENVDLIFAMIAPENANEAHLQVLAHMAKQFSNGYFRKQLRQAKDHLALYQTATTHEQA